LAEYGVTRIEDLPVNFGGLALQEGEENSNRIFDANYGDLWRLYERQQTVRSAGGALFPLLAMQPVSMSLTGNDGAHHQHFANAAEQYRRQIQVEMNSDLAVNSKYKDNTYKAGPAWWEQVQRFVYRAPGSNWALSNQLGPVALLCAWCVGALLLALFGIRRLRAV